MLLMKQITYRFFLDGPENSIAGSPWGAEGATVTWNYTGEQSKKQS